MKQRFALILTMVLLFFTSCSQRFKNEYDFRNYLRDKHPYTEITSVDLGFWSYQVVDTTNNVIWIYIGSRSESHIKQHRISFLNNK